MTLGLVLGAGGTVGLAYHAGVLRALEVEGGLDPASADLVIGTSAGSVIAAYLRTGWSTAQLWELVMSAVDLPPGPEPAVNPEEVPLPDLFVAAFNGPSQLARRALGSAYVLSRSMVRAPLPALPGPLRRAFPGGMFHMTGGRRRFSEELPADWPEQPTWLCAVDIVSGRRMVLGRRRPSRLTLPQAVAASCAIPGVYPPVRYGRRELIDGGAHSTTNLDLAGRFGCDVVIGIAPLAYGQGEGRCLLGEATRAWASRSLAQEAAAVRRRGTEVLLLAPGRHEIGVHGLNMMRSGNLAPVAESAYEATARALTGDDWRRVLDGAAA